jgi:hypothetical protein
MYSSVILDSELFGQFHDSSEENEIEKDLREPPNV